MKVLIVGSGGREHALGWKIAQSSKVTRLYFAPGNAGTAKLGVNLPIAANDFEELKTFAIETQLDMMIVGPEQPLVEGIYDFFTNDPLLKHVKVFAPSQAGARLEGSKDFAKAFMLRHNIPTAAYKTFTSMTYVGACKYIEELKPPYVIKADGLAAGKGVIICSDEDEAKEEIRKILLDEKFGEAGAKVVIEEFLQGIELSVFVVTDGTSYQILPEAKDYKRIGENDTGLNTGGMGSISPVPFADNKFMSKVEERIIKPTIEGIKKEGIRYHGFIFFGLINVKGDPYVIEYNARLGDPEAESILMRVKNDLFEVLLQTVEGNLNTTKIRFDSRSVASVVMVSGGYPNEFETGKVINGIDGITNSNIFHAATKLSKTGELESNGGRVLVVSSYGKNLLDALATTYKSVKTIDFEKKYYRKDIGKDLFSRS